jgi:hypothetical protein
MRCSICGANIEITRFDDGSTLIRKDCSCKLSGEKKE